jgi:iron-sulfur cluster insertion protein
MDLANPIRLPPKVTERAYARLAEIGAAVLRVAVDGGGCSGFQYRFELAEAPEADDVVLGSGPRVVVDPVSLPFLAGATIDFTEELIGARFAVENPNATASCGCGTSFSV